LLLHRPMARSDLIALLALIVSGLSLGVSWWGAFRDRVRLKVTAKLSGGGEYEEYGPEHIAIRVVNTGRRVAVLTLFGGQLADGGWQGTGLGKSGAGLHLTESQFYEQDFGYADIEAVSPDGTSEYVSLWFEDSHGRRHSVPNSAALIATLKRNRRSNG
jgi:hypothetical protein